MSRNQRSPSALTATQDCVRAFAFSSPARRPRQFEQLQFHCGKPPPAAVPSRRTNIFLVSLIPERAASPFHFNPWRSFLTCRSPGQHSKTGQGIDRSRTGSREETGPAQSPPPPSTAHPSSISALCLLSPCLASAVLLSRLRFKQQEYACIGSALKAHRNDFEGRLDPPGLFLHVAPFPFQAAQSSSAVRCSSTPLRRTL